MTKIDWCIDCNMPKAQCLCNEGEPKAVRVIVTVMYSNGQSVLADIKNPDFVEFSNDSSNDAESVGLSNYRVWPEDTFLDLHIKTKINRQEPALLSFYPTDIPII